MCVRVYFVGLFLVVFGSFDLYGDPLPQWLQIPDDYDAVCERIGSGTWATVLNSWEKVVYEGSGRMRRTVGKAVHIKDSSESRRAVVTIPLLGKSQRIRNFRAWLVSPSGIVEEYGQEDGYVIADDLAALYSERRMFIVDKSASVGAGDVVFAYEYEMTERSVFYQNEWVFQSDIPTLKSQLEIKYPKGWRLIGRVFGEHEVTVEDKGGSYVWKTRNVPPVNLGEVGRPPLKSLLSQVGISVFPEGKSSVKGSYHVFKYWSDVAAFGEQAQRKHVVSSPELNDKAIRLVDEAGSLWAGIQAIGEYVQSINYVPISVDLAKGGGYEPRDAFEVFATHRGDCKDMTVLAIAMLKAVGVEAWPVMANISAEGSVFYNWVSPFHFNHCIVGISVGDELDVSGGVEVPELGKVLLFDPTDKFTPIGYVPHYLKGQEVLVNDERVGDLVEVPWGDGINSVEDRNITIHLDDDGSMHGVIRIKATGDTASYWRQQCKGLSDYELKSRLRNWLSEGALEADIETVRFDDEFKSNRFELEIRFLSLFYGRIVTGAELMIFKPIFLERNRLVGRGNGKRSNPFVSKPKLLRELIRFEWDSTFELENSIGPVVDAESFARFEMVVDEVGADWIQLKRNWESNHDRIEAKDYYNVTNFFDRVERAEDRSIVLKLRD